MKGVPHGRVWMILALIIGLYAVGFIVFVLSLPKSTPKTIRADGIVALTGGGARLDVAEALLEQGAGRRLLISGVYSANTKDKLKQVMHGGRRFDCCADLGFAAQSTRGNATEAAQWAHEHGYRSLLIVTSNYHMPRSLNEFSAEMPGIRLLPYPVSESDINVDNWWSNPHTLRVLNTEYAKYLGSLFFSALVWHTNPSHPHLRESERAI